MDINDIVERGGAKAIEDNKQSTAQTNTYGKEDKVYLAKDLDVAMLKRENKRFGIVSEKKVELPQGVVETIKSVSMELASKGFVLRAEASDRNPLEQVVFPTFAYKEIFLPSPGINKLVTPILKKPTDTAFSYAAWLYCLITGDRAKDSLGQPMEAIDKFNSYAYMYKAFKARNMHIYLGEKLNEIVDFMIIYSPCGSTSLSRETNWEKLGWEPSRVLKDCKSDRLNIKVYNLGSEESTNELLEAIKTM
jgi:hypothetical protein